MAPSPAARRWAVSLSCRQAVISDARPGRTAETPQEWGYDGNFREVVQTQSGVLSSDTTLVALTIGGNDAGFPLVMQQCALTGCPAEADVQRDIDDTMPEIEDVLEEINNKAPNANFILLGYPQLFNEDAVACVSGVGGAGMGRLNAMARYMAMKQEQLTASMCSRGIPVSYESPDSDFQAAEPAMILRASTRL